MNLAKARLLLDGVISLELPGVDPLHYITADAKLVHDVAFENGIVSFNTLHEDEKDALKSCLNYNPSTYNNLSDILSSTNNFAIDILESNKRQKWLFLHTLTSPSYLLLLSWQKVSSHKIPSLLLSCVKVCLLIIRNASCF